MLTVLLVLPLVDDLMLLCEVTVVFVCAVAFAAVALSSSSSSSSLREFDDFLGDTDTAL